MEFEVKDFAYLNDPRDIEIICLNYGISCEKMTKRDIGKKFNISGSRVSALIATAMMRIESKHQDREDRESKLEGRRLWARQAMLKRKFDDVSSRLKVSEVRTSRLSDELNDITNEMKKCGMSIV